MYALQHTQLQQDNTVLRLCHPLIFQTFKPIQTTGDGSCLYHALSLALIGTEACTDLLRLLALHALVKHKATIMSAFRDAFPLATEHVLNVKYTTAIRKAVGIHCWGTDYHLFALSLLLDRPIFNTPQTPTVVSLLLTLLSNMLRDFVLMSLVPEYISSIVPAFTEHCYLVEMSSLSLCCLFLILIIKTFTG